MGDNRKFWEEQGEAWKPLNEKKKKEKKEPNLEAGATEDAPLVVRKGNWRNHSVNGHGFTVFLATFAVCVIAGVLLGAAMVISGTAKEVQELAPAPKDYQKSEYGEKHSGVGFANYVVGNAVQSFWQKEMGKKGPQKMTDPFASFLLKKKGKKGSRSSAETPEQQADDAQPVDQEHGKIAGNAATPQAIQHAKDVALAHGTAASHAGKRGRSSSRAS